MARILEPSVHAYRVTPVDEMGLLIDADDYYREFYRAALSAERYLLLSGWQFDSDVALVRGPLAEQADAPATLLKFLDWLCRRNPALRIWILAWDFALVFAAEREWMQSVIFQWTTHERLQFRFDDNHVERGCHHQKFVVIDGELSFLGGLDLCDDRWDDRRHLQHNPLRLSRDEPHKPFHDVQAYLRGREVASALAELFVARWQRAGGSTIELPPVEARAGARERNDVEARAGARGQSNVQGLWPLAAKSVALSRTDPHGTPGGPKLCAEIKALHLAAIDRAEQLIYVETQYFSARAIAEALERRMHADGRSRLEIVLIVNMRGETLKEQAAVGLAQAQIIDRLRTVAGETGHQLGIYYTLPACDAEETPERATYIHSKLMIVDDRFLTIGSANLTNRSMAIDTELNATVESERADDDLGRSIRSVRLELLAEHTGLARADARQLARVRGLVAMLEDLADPDTRPERVPACRLRRHPSPTKSERAALALIDPQKLPFDPDEVEELKEELETDFVSNLSQTLRELFATRRDRG